jgi:hypothetical protein
MIAADPAFLRGIYNEHLTTTLQEAAFTRPESNLPIRVASQVPGAAHLFQSDMVTETRLQSRTWKFP